MCVYIYIRLPPLGGEPGVCGLFSLLKWFPHSGLPTPSGVRLFSSGELRPPSKTVSNAASCSEPFLDGF